MQVLTALAPHGKRNNTFSNTTLMSSRINSIIQYAVISQTQDHCILIPTFLDTAKTRRKTLKVI